MIRHHPSDMTLLRYAAGMLPAPHVQVVAVHIGHCPECVEALLMAEAIGGTLIEAQAPTSLSADGLERTLRRLDEHAAPKPALAPELAPAPITLAGLSTGRWRWSGPGIAMQRLIPRDATDTRLDLIRVAPGTSLLLHGHTGFETTCVLQGAFEDGVNEYRVGDFAEGDAGLEHRPTALAGEDCICVIATSGQLRPQDWLGRIVRPLLGM